MADQAESDTKGRTDSETSRMRNKRAWLLRFSVRQRCASSRPHSRFALVMSPVHQYAVPRRHREGVLAFMICMVHILQRSRGLYLDTTKMVTGQCIQHYLIPLIYHCAQSVGQALGVQTMSKLRVETRNCRKQHEEFKERAGRILMTRDAMKFFCVEYPIIRHPVALSPCMTSELSHSNNRYVAKRGDKPALRYIPRSSQMCADALPSFLTPVSN